MIGGFPAVVAAPKQFSDYCNVDIDVAQGQILDVQFGAERWIVADSAAELCHRARREPRPSC